MSVIFKVDLWNSVDNRKEFAEQVCEGMSRDGFLAVKGHGITADMLEAAQTATLKLFAMNEETLEFKYGRPDLFRQRGVSPLGTERAVGYQHGDRKRFWMTRLEEEPDLPEDNPYGENIWPDREVPEFQPAILALMQECLDCGREILRAMEIGYGLPRGRLVDMTRGSESILRSIYYPPFGEDEAEDGAMRSAPHEDINLLTVLPPADEKGLELFLGGEWRPVDPEPGVVLVNIGEMIAEVAGITDLVATKHQVRNPVGSARLRPRCSWPLFLHARRSVELRPGLLAGNWFDDRIRRITVG